MSFLDAISPEKRALFEERAHDDDDVPSCSRTQYKASTVALAGFVNPATTTPSSRIECTEEVDGMCSKVNNYLSDLSRFLTARNLTLSSTKSTATIFTNWTKEYRLELNIAVDGVKIPTVNNPKILGVTFDSLCSFTPHTTAIIAKVQSRNKILKSLAGSTWGKDKETLLAIYKVIGRSVLNYAAPIWSPGCSGTQIRKLQTCQNTALRATTGCLLSETRKLPVKEHNELLSRQFLLGCFRRNHPCSHLLRAEPPPRSIKRSFLDYVDDIEQYADRTSAQQTFDRY
ncbi:uncharacterized protein LOC125777615 [Bactrocera dorsalis]|uniref:Uncharacterized protein LOC125777615 n=1 Tax=Bactrocera dorsalis TaxID=27457 RepID=A0ABM3JHG3_BACDO|nr:uncharacterized protein LOC125777615 [Bactrocera dorsalis]